MSSHFTRRIQDNIAPPPPPPTHTHTHVHFVLRTPMTTIWNGRLEGRKCKFRSTYDIHNECCHHIAKLIPPVYNLQYFIDVYHKIDISFFLFSFFLQTAIFYHRIDISSSSSFYHIIDISSSSSFLPQNRYFFFHFYFYKLPYFIDVYHRIDISFFFFRFFLQTAIFYHRIDISSSFSSSFFFFTNCHILFMFTTESIYLLFFVFFLCFFVTNCHILLIF